jgi:uncharacterized membrane protein YgdD (TMEM256/DUF423 family)
MNSNYIKTMAGSGALCVALGAFGAHGLKDHISPQLLESFKTGVNYHMFHTLALGIVYFLGVEGFIAKPKLIYNLFFVGIICFSGSLYGMAFASYFGIELNWLGPITPIGGLFFIAGWLLLTYNTIKRNDISI